MNDKFYQTSYTPLAVALFTLGFKPFSNQPIQVVKSTQSGKKKALFLIETTHKHDVFGDIKAYQIEGIWFQDKKIILESNPLLVECVDYMRSFSENRFNAVSVVQEICDHGKAYNENVRYIENKVEEVPHLVMVKQGRLNIVLSSNASEQTIQDVQKLIKDI